MTATHFQISIPDEELHQLKAKLELATFPDELDHAGWTHGSPLSDVKRLVTHWRDNFDWRMAEAKLNELPQFRTRVPVEGFGELDIHFVHQRNDIDGAIPLLFCHGWVIHPCLLILTSLRIYIESFLPIILAKNNFFEPAKYSGRSRKNTINYTVNLSFTYRHRYP